MEKIGILSYKKSTPGIGNFMRSFEEMEHLKIV